LQKTWHLSDTEVERITGRKPKPNGQADAADAEPPARRLSVAEELEQIGKLRTADPKRYFSKETQDRQLALIEQEQAAKAERTKRPAETSDRLAVIAKDLRDIDQTRRNRRSDVTKEMEAQELALLEEQQTLKLGIGGLPKSVRDEWSENGALEQSLQTARATAEQAFAELDETEQLEFVDGFDELPEGAQAGIYRYVAIEPSTRWRPASEAQVKQLAELDPDLVQEFGTEAPRRLGQLAGRYRLMLQGMSAEDRAKTEAWVDNLTPAQRRAVAKAMTR
jgi:hypothetical protein